MKKYLFYTLSLFFLGCNNDDTIENNSTQIKIQTLTIQDEDVKNGNLSLYEKLDFKFEYNNNRLVKVWDINNNYLENLTYNNNFLSEINISGYRYPELHLHMPLKVKRKLTYDNNQRLTKSESLDDSNSPAYTVFEYPSSDIIVAKDYKKNDYGEITPWMTSKIYISNQNVTKVETYYETIPPLLMYVVKYEYDQKLNPNFLIDKNRILALPNYAFNVSELQDYSQLSRNNVTKKERYGVGGQPEILMKSTDFYYTYKANDLPANIYMNEGNPDVYLKISAIYGY